MPVRRLSSIFMIMRQPERMSLPGTSSGVSTKDPLPSVPSPLKGARESPHCVPCQGQLRATPERDPRYLPVYQTIPVPPAEGHTDYEGKQCSREITCTVPLMKGDTAKPRGILLRQPRSTLRGILMKEPARLSNFPIPPAEGHIVMKGDTAKPRGILPLKKKAPR